MPRINGCELATASDDAKHRAMTQEAGFDAHVAKPADPHLLQSKHNFD